MTASLIVTIDTEEEGLWAGRYRRTGNTVENIRHVPRFQALCDRFGVRPTFLVDAAVAADDRAVDVLRAIHDEGRCEIGTHLHPWCNPPFEEEDIPRNSYLCNLPEPLQRAKLLWLTERIEERFGRRPTSFRAGRYGLDIVGARLLAELGYLVDSSVIPFTSYAAESGPDFSDVPLTPYFIGGDDLRIAQNSGSLLEVPVSLGYNRVDFERAHALRQAAAAPWLKWLHGVGILDRLGLVRRIKFSPEQAGTAELTQLVDHSLARGAPAMVLMFHSSSLMPGGSPYVRDAAGLERFLARLCDVFEYCLNRRGMAADTMSGFAAQWAPIPAEAVP